MQTQLINREALVNPALIQENRRLRAELEKANKQNAMLKKALKGYHEKSLHEYSVKENRRNQIGELVAEIVLAGRWAFAAGAFMVVMWNVWMAVWGMNI